MEKKGEFRENSEAVQAHLSITQSVIQRMASNSASCKAWCITLVSAILVIVADKGKPQYSMIAVIPTLLFFVLDTYYLALEKTFIQAYNAFIEKLHNRDIVASDLYAISPKGSLLKSFFCSLVSFSTWPLYTTLLLMIWIAKIIVI
jgi:hypothetical protein